MLAICLKLLSILGILLLVLLGLLLAILLLVLFYPVTYRIRGRKDEQELALSVKIKWLSGLIRVQYQYPEPGRVKLKLLCFSLYDMKIPPDKPVGGKKEEKPKKADPDTPKGSQPVVQSKEENSDTQGLSHEAVIGENLGTDEAPDVDSAGSEEGSCEKTGKFSDKIGKIKYTIQGIYDKIKKIWENISYYIELLREEDTKELFAHAFKVSCKILKSIRPRRMKADILLGTGSPDTTGYIYGIYCMLTASLKPGFLMTPDFERKLFQGEFDLAGHVCIGVLFINGLRLLLDKKLHIFIRKIRKKAKTK